jgi:protein-S-isoprenylcysteine O-methyltransferase Ste14
MRKIPPPEARQKFSTSSSVFSSMDFCEHDFKRPLRFFFRRPWDVEPEGFWSRGGGWVVAQFIVVACWLLLTPKGNKLAGSALVRAFAAVLLTAGAALGVSGALVLGKSLTPFPKPPAQAQLVRHGIYATIRHPLYAGLIALSFGWACLWGSGRGGALALVQTVLLDAKARREERWLREKFPSYNEYARRVRRLIPLIY